MCELKYNPENVIDNNPKSWGYAAIKKCEDIPNLISTIINEDYGDFYLIPKDNEDKNKLKPIHDYLQVYETINKYLRNETKSDELSETTINNYLRNETKFDELSETQKLIIKVQKSLSKFTLQEPIVLYRGCPETIYEHMVTQGAELKDELKDDGKYLVDKSFISTSIVEEERFSPETGFPYHNIQLRIFAPKGTQAFYVGNLIGEGSREEILLQKKTILEIISEPSNSKGYIDCLLLPNEKQAYWPKT